MKKIILAIVFTLLLGVVIFYFWGSSSTYDQTDYDIVVTYDSRVQKEFDTLSVLTYNIGYLSGMTNNLPVERLESLFSSNLRKSIKVLESYDFDFIGLQEVDFGSARSFDYNQFDSLGNQLDFYQGAYAVNWDKSYVPFPYFPVWNQFGRMLSGQGVLSKMQVIANDIQVLEKPLSAPFYYKAFYLDRLIQITKVQVGFRSLVLMNVHLEAFDRETRELQAEKVLEVFRSFSAEYPVILMGDFNSRPPFASKILEKERTVEMFLEDDLIGEAISEDRYLSDERQFFTFDTEDPYERLDYIFYNKNKIKKIDSDVLRAAGDISDHLPVWMTFTLID